jgi:hypothetical protein
LRAAAAFSSLLTFLQDLRSASRKFTERFVWNAKGLFRGRVDPDDFVRSSFDRSTENLLFCRPH